MTVWAAMPMARLGKCCCARCIGWREPVRAGAGERAGELPPADHRSSGIHPLIHAQTNPCATLPVSKGPVGAACTSPWFGTAMVRSSLRRERIRIGWREPVGAGAGERVATESKLRGPVALVRSTCAAGRNLRGRARQPLLRSRRGRSPHPREPALATQCGSVHFGRCCAPSLRQTIEKRTLRRQALCSRVEWRMGLSAHESTGGCGWSGGRQEAVRRREGFGPSRCA